MSFVGDGFSLLKEGKRYFLTYPSGALHGKVMKAEISELDYTAAKKGRISLIDFLSMYDLKG